MLKRMLVMLTLFVLFVGGFIGWKVHSIHQAMAQMAANFTAPSVSAMTVAYQDWQPQLQAVGSLRAVNGADLSSEVAGIVEDIKFDSGNDVDTGTVLVRLRAEDDIAKLKSLQAAYKISNINFDRDQKQLKAQAVSQATVDNDKAVLDGAKAQVDAQQAIVDKKTIRAPFAGHLGIRQVDIGQYLNSGTAIVTLQQLDPIYIDFSLPEDSIPRLAIGQKVSVHTDALDKIFIGTIAAINTKVDTDTRNISVRATLHNPDHTLLPGMFASVTVDAGLPVRYLTVPQSAIVFNTYGNTVYIVKDKAADDKDKAEGAAKDASTADASKPDLITQQTVVVTGETRGDQIAVLSGIKEGDQVVTSGQVKLHSGAAVQINNDVQPSNEPNPAPHEQ